MHRITYYDGHQKWVEIDYRDGKENGKVIMWLPDGQKISETEIRDGKAHGKRICWHKNGQRQAEVEFRDGVEVSRVEWDENGNRVNKDGNLIKEE